MLYIVALLTCIVIAPVHAASNASASAEASGASALDAHVIEANRTASLCVPFNPYYHSQVQSAAIQVDVRSLGNDEFLRFQKLVHSFGQPLEDPQQLMAVFIKWTYVLEKGFPEFDETIGSLSEKIKSIHITCKYELVSILTKLMEQTHSLLSSGNLNGNQLKDAFIWMCAESTQVLLQEKLPMANRKVELNNSLERLKCAQWIPGNIA